MCRDKDYSINKKGQYIYAPTWNATLANTTLIALASSAPELMLNMTETVSNLGKCPGLLAAPTIIGSCAVNTILVPAVGIYVATRITARDLKRGVRKE